VCAHACCISIITNLTEISIDSGRGSPSTIAPSIPLRKIRNRTRDCRSHARSDTFVIRRNSCTRSEIDEARFCTFPSHGRPYYSTLLFGRPRELRPLESSSIRSYFRATSRLAIGASHPRGALPMRSGFDDAFSAVRDTRPCVRDSLRFDTFPARCRSGKIYCRVFT